MKGHSAIVLGIFVAAEVMLTSLTVRCRFGSRTAFMARQRDNCFCVLGHMETA